MSGDIKATFPQQDPVAPVFRTAGSPAVHTGQGAPGAQTGSPGKASSPAVKKIATGTQPELAKTTGEAASGQDKKAVEHALSRINETLDLMNRSLHFQIQEESGQVYVEVVNRETGEIIKTIPSEEIVQLKAKLEEMAGILFDVKK